MIVLMPDEMKKLDKRTDEIFGLSLEILMENAGRGILRFIEEKFHTLKKITFICGKGNNGGDGFVTSRYLKLRGYDVIVYTFGEKREYKGEALLNLNLLEKTGCEIRKIEEKSLLKFDIGTSDLVVDGVFGTGFKGELKENYKEIFKIINDYSRKILSIDIPSGVDGERGSADEDAINADYTVTFAYPKTGHYLYPGKMKRGRLYLVDIGIPYYYAEEEFERYIITFEIAKENMPERKPYFHKGNCGKVFVLSGSKGYTGAPSMVAMGALRAGAGLVMAALAAKETSEVLRIYHIDRGYEKLEEKIRKINQREVIESIKKRGKEKCRGKENKNKRKFGKFQLSSY